MRSSQESCKRLRIESVTEGTMPYAVQSLSLFHTFWTRMLPGLLCVCVCVCVCVRVCVCVCISVSLSFSLSLSLGDRKRKGAAKQSDYYRRHGNPHTGQAGAVNLSELRCVGVQSHACVCVWRVGDGTTVCVCRGGGGGGVWMVGTTVCMCVLGGGGGVWMVATTGASEGILGWCGQPPEHSLVGLG